MNGLVKSLYAGVVVSAAILSASIPARAADTEQPPAMQDVPELVVSAPATGGWYLRGDLGASWSRVRRVDFADTDSYSGGGYRGSFQFGGGAGYASGGDPSSMIGGAAAGFLAPRIAGNLLMQPAIQGLLSNQLGRTMVAPPPLRSLLHALVNRSSADESAPVGELLLGR